MYGAIPTIGFSPNFAITLLPFPLVVLAKFLDSVGKWPWE
jgi:hypothetical protein